MLIKQYYQSNNIEKANDLYTTYHITVLSNLVAIRYMWRQVDFSYVEKSIAVIYTKILLNVSTRTFWLEKHCRISFSCKVYSTVQPEYNDLTQKPKNCFRCWQLAITNVETLVSKIVVVVDRWSLAHVWHMIRKESSQIWLVISFLTLNKNIVFTPQKNVSNFF